MNYSIRWTNQIDQIPQNQWDALAIPLETPFLEWEWLYNLEASGSIKAQTGWLPNHLTLWSDRTLIAAAPLYLKGHSYGEFVFDHQFADLASRLGIEYYPKLLGATPVTPALGYRFLIAPNQDQTLITQLMIKEIDRFCQQHKISSCHFLYVDPNWQSIPIELGFHKWLHHSYVWENQNYQTFDDYLKSFNANQRRNIKRERKAIEKAGLQIKLYKGDQISKTLLSRMYDFYSDHCDKFGWWGSKYLNRSFFENLHIRYKDRILLTAAYSEGINDPIGMSFCITKGELLYGRYWGASEDIDCLHFEACYYSPIQWAIEHKIKTFDPGAGGSHKKRRGFPASPNYSLHRFYNSKMNQILQNYLAEINLMEQRQIDLINEQLPFKET